MTVEGLIDKLKHFDPNMRVVTPGFDEDNLEDVDTVDEVWVVFHDDRPCGHYGRHEELWRKRTQGEKGIKAVKINF